MPIYEYACKACEHHFEAIQKFSDQPLTECPECGKAALAKQVSAPSFRLRGSGWYETDFKTGNRRHGTQDTQTGSSKTGANKAGESKADSKPDGKKSAPGGAGNSAGNSAGSTAA